MKKKVENYFNGITKEPKNTENEFISKIKIKKDEFIERLNKANKITSFEIRDLIKANYLSNFQKFTGTRIKLKNSKFQ